jgi:hypothetical protein
MYLWVVTVCVSYISSIANWQKFQPQSTKASACKFFVLAEKSMAEFSSDLTKKY